MTDLLLLLGSALCVLSVILAVISVAQTRAPRSAAAALVLGILLMFLGAWLSPDPFRVHDLGAVWQGLAAGRLHR